MSDLYNIEYGDLLVTNAPLNEAIAYAVQWMGEHDTIEVSKGDNVEVHVSGCDKLTITPPLPEEHSQFMNTERYIKV